ncbi:MAG: T9SS type A sorting domain-containing protein [Bacteroidetes bacterium]|nr:T9SS type A sorting domain-containing protein [Bacteroidota bacterium]
MIRTIFNRSQIKFFIFICGLFFSLTSSGQNVTVAGANPLTPNGTFATLNAAFTAINARAQNALNITITITNNTTELVSANLNQSSGPWASLTIQPAGLRTITGAILGPLINLNGADNVTINGLNAGGNTLTLSNTSTSNQAATIKFVLDATNNLVTNCTILGSSLGIFNAAADGAVIWFSNASVAAGNDNNMISNNDLGPAGANLPGIYIKSHCTTAGKDNSNITITGNRIHDYYSSGQMSAGVYAFTGSSGWTITNNRIYQTNTLSLNVSGNPYPANTYSAIVIKAGNGYTITGNYCGFANAAGTGFTVITNTVSNYAGSVQVILINTIAGAASTVSNNVIGGFDLTSSRSSGTAGTGIFYGIYVENGSTTVSNNVIGAVSGTNSIVIKSTNNSVFTAFAPAFGIYLAGNIGAETVTGNTIGGISFLFPLPNPTNGDRVGFAGIYNSSSGGLISITGNTIGNSTANNITSVHRFGNVVGIHNTVSLFAVNISNNTIQNITVSAANTGVDEQASIVGILDIPIAGAAATTIAQNTITALSNTAASGAIQVRGIFCKGGASNISTVDKNKISALSIASSTNTSSIAGLTMKNVNQVNAYNNFISLGSGLSNDLVINGIEHVNGAGYVYFNSVRILGTASGSANTYAFNYNTSSTFLSIKNTILYNERTGGSGKHYAIRMQGSSSPAYTAAQGTNNLLYTTAAPLANYAGLDCATLALWNANCGGGDPVTASKTATVVFTSATDLHTADFNVRNAGISLSPTVVDDIDLFVRPSCVDIGADEFDPGSIAGTTYTWLGSVDDKWCEACNWDRETVPPSTADVLIKDDRPHYPLLQAGAGCGNVTVNDFTVQQNATPAKSALIDLATYTLTVTGDVTINGSCNCTGASAGGLITEGLIDVASTTQQQILDIRNASGNFPGQICRLRINKTQPTGVASNRHEAILKGNLNILYSLDFANGVLLSRNGATYDADENTGVNFKTINILNDDPASVTRQTIGAQNTRNGFFEGRLNRKIINVGTKNEYLYPLGFRTTGGTGVLGDYSYCPSLVQFASSTNNNYLVGTYLNNNNNFVVDGVFIGNTGHGCGNPFEIDDQGGQTATTCLNHEIDLVGDFYWDFQENNGANATGDPAIFPGALGPVDYSIECAGDGFNLQAMDGLTGSELRLLKRPSVAVPDSTGQGAWVTIAGVHNGIDISLNPGIALYSIAAANLQGARRDDLTSFSGFAGAGNGPSPLPVELLYFSAEKSGKSSVLCTWATSSEINNDYFEVYAARELAGVFGYTKIAFVTGHGTTSEQNTYSIVDDQPVQGKNYYKLRQVDFDGQSKESEAVVVLFNSGKNFELIAVSPNPFSENPHLYLQANEAGKLVVQVENSIGQLIVKEEHYLNRGSRTLDLALPSSLSSGIYFVHLLFDGEQFVTKLVKK